MIGTGVAAIALQGAVKWVVVVAIAGIGILQGWQAHLAEQRRRRQRKNDFQRRLTVLYNQLHKLWQPVNNRVILNNQAIRIAKANNDPSLVAQLEAERPLIEQAKDEAVTIYRIDFSPEAESLPHEIYSEFGIDPSVVLDIIGDHPWNASFDDINKIGEAIVILGKRLYYDE